MRRGTFEDGVLIKASVPEGERVRLNERVTLEAPRLLFGYAFAQARAAHRALMQGVQSALEG